MDSQLLPFATQDVPRYTSYPTAVQFQSPFPGQAADDWLIALEPEATLSVYAHIPFCRQLCWYCGCHTSVPLNRRSQIRSGAVIDGCEVCGAILYPPEPDGSA